MDKEKLSRLLSKIKGISIELNDRDPEEPPITSEQLEQIKRLTDEVLPDEMIRELGKWQAAQLLLKLNEDQLSDSLAEADRYDNKISMLKKALVLAALFFAALFLITLILKMFKH